MKKIILLFLIVNTLNSQSFTDLTEQNLYRGGNVFLLDKMNNYDDDIDDGEKFYENTLNNVRADHENQTLTFIDAKGNNIEIFIGCLNIKKKDKAKFRIFKGDGDQDRPS